MQNSESNMQNGLVPGKVRKSKVVRGKTVYWVGDRAREYRPKRTLLERFDSLVIKKDGCWDWRGYICASYKYPMISNGYRTMKASRVSWMLFRGDIPDGLCVLHKCDNQRCTNPEHLFLGTHLDNMRDMIAKKRDFNIKHVNTKIKDEDVIYIRKMRGLVYARELAKRFGVTKDTIRKLWQCAYRKNLGG